MVTSAVGCASNFTVKLAVLPNSSVVNPVVGATVILAGGATFRAKASELIPPSASVTVTVILAVPFWLAAGVTVKVRSLPAPPKTILLLGTKVGLSDVTATCKSATGVSTSPMVKGMAAVTVFWAVVWLVISVIVGRSLTGFTVRVKVSDVAWLLPSVTVTVISELPARLAAGVTVRVRSLPLPPKTILAAGIKVRLLEVNVTCKSATAVWSSPIVKGIAAVAISSLVIWLVISLIVGGVSVKRLICRGWGVNVNPGAALCWFRGIVVKLIGLPSNAGKTLKVNRNRGAGCVPGPVQFEVGSAHVAEM